MGVGGGHREGGGHRVAELVDHGEDHCADGVARRAEQDREVDRRPRRRESPLERSEEGGPQLGVDVDLGHAEGAGRVQLMGGQARGTVEDEGAVDHGVQASQQVEVEGPRLVGGAVDVADRDR